VKQILGGRTTAPVTVIAMDRRAGEFALQLPR
jgi:hypothetical protein